MARIFRPIAQLPRRHSNVLEVARVGAGGKLGPGPLYFLARLHYYLDARDIAPRSEGLSVSRRYLNLAGHQITEIRAGTPVTCVAALKEVMSLIVPVL